MRSIQKDLYCGSEICGFPTKSRGNTYVFFRSGSLSSSSGVDVGRRDSTHRSERSSSMLHNPFQVLRRRRPRELKNPTHRSERTSSALLMKRRGTSLKIPCLWQFSPSHPTMPVNTSGLFQNRGHEAWAKKELQDLNAQVATKKQQIDDSINATNEHRNRFDALQRLLGHIP